MQKELGTTGITYCASAEETFSKADALIILTEWEEFANLNYSKLLPKLSEKK